MQLSIYLCSFSSTCFGLIRPSSGAMDVTISYEFPPLHSFTNHSFIYPFSLNLLTGHHMLHM